LWSLYDWCHCKKRRLDIKGRQSRISTEKSLINIQQGAKKRGQEKSGLRRIHTCHHFDLRFSVSILKKSVSLVHTFQSAEFCYGDPSKQIQNLL
jgi:hypothetical protein